jgi:two-component system KDP operon response regulator KdpE
VSAAEGPRPIVLAVEDDPQIRRFLRTALSAESLEVVEAETGARALVEAAMRKPEVVILDLGLPDMDGKDVIRRLREWSDVPVLVLSARTQEAQKVEALDAGADDYLTKPFGAAELLARIRVALRRRARTETGEPALEVGDLRIDLAARRVAVRGEGLHLTPIEYRLMAALARHAGKVLTHRQLLREVWGEAYAEQTHTLRVHMASLRRKVEADPAKPRYLLTELGVGYRLAAE